jgi:hypothetical protein
MAQGTLEEQIEAAFGFRGHVTVHLRDGSQVEGYLYNRELRRGPSFVDLFLKGSGDGRRLATSDIARIELTGQDCAQAPG